MVFSISFFCSFLPSMLLFVQNTMCEILALSPVRCVCYVCCALLVYVMGIMPIHLTTSSSISPPLLSPPFALSSSFFFALPLLLPFVRGKLCHSIAQKTNRRIGTGEVMRLKPSLPIFSGTGMVVDRVIKRVVDKYGMDGCKKEGCVHGCMAAW